jgi:hypothetical protein
MTAEGDSSVRAWSGHDPYVGQGWQTVDLEPSPGGGRIEQSAPDKPEKLSFDKARYAGERFCRRGNHPERGGRESVACSNQLIN